MGSCTCIFIYVWVHVYAYISKSCNIHACEEPKKSTHVHVYTMQCTFLTYMYILCSVLYTCIYYVVYIFIVHTCIYCISQYIHVYTMQCTFLLFWQPSSVAGFWRRDMLFLLQEAHDSSTQNTKQKRTHPTEHTCLSSGSVYVGYLRVHRPD